MYFVIPKSGSAYWMVRYTSNKKRKEMTLGKYSDLSLKDVRFEAASKMQQLRDGLDPLLAKKRAEQESIKTVDDLFEDWYPTLEARLKHPKIPKRIYTKDIAPHIGEFKIDQVTARDIRTTIEDIKASGRLAIANDALGYCKQLFNHGRKLDLLAYNPAATSTFKDAGGAEKSRERASGEELKVRAFGSEYVFPSRRTSKKPHMGADILNRAITKLFGHVAERSLNQKLKGVEGIYNKHDYLTERKKAQSKLASFVFGTNMSFRL